MQRDSDKARNRLLAYYRKLGYDDLPITFCSASEVEDQIKSLPINQNEFLVVKYKGQNDVDIYVSNVNIFIIRKGVKIFNIQIDSIKGIYLNKDFKNIEVSKDLNIVTNDNSKIKISFEDVHVLTSARNEIYHIVDAAIENWEGKSFRADKLDFHGTVLIF